MNEKLKWLHGGKFKLKFEKFNKTLLLAAWMDFFSLCIIVQQDEREFTLNGIFPRFCVTLTHHHKKISAKQSSNWHPRTNLIVKSSSIPHNDSENKRFCHFSISILLIERKSKINLLDKQSPYDVINFFSFISFISKSGKF